MILVQQPLVSGRAAPQKIEADGNGDQRSVVDRGRSGRTRVPQVLRDQCGGELYDGDAEQQEAVLEKQPDIAAADVKSQ
jgi:hypothetical protein